ncbi:MAG: MoxR family ATPase [Lentisphaeria bacterium]|nr:MoxR family ATPase [Lentisphaeria bacterium]
MNTIAQVIVNGLGETMTEEYVSKINKLNDNICQVVVGKDEVVKAAIVTMLAGGHILLEDVPGVGKTMLARAISGSIDGEFKRIQFTADLLPSDISGVNIFNQSENTFEFRAGPVFTNVLLGDEINRATPRTQSSLLEAMEEYHITVDGVTYPLSKPFLVIATQNPIELEGTYPLPFAQMDRFMTRLSMGYLKKELEVKMLQDRIHDIPIDNISSVITCEELKEIQEAVPTIEISSELLNYTVEILSASRVHNHINVGASPRAGLDMLKFAQASALYEGRNYVLPDDIKYAALTVLNHRIVIKRGTGNQSLSAGDLIPEIVDQVAVPV